MGRLMVILASLTFLASWMTDNQAARIAAAILVAPLLVDLLWKGGRMPQLEFVVGPRRTEAGARFLEQVAVRNTGARRVCFDLVLAENYTATLAGGAYIEHLPPGVTAQVTLPARCRRRGRRAERVFFLETTYPLGVIRSSATVSVASELVSEPARVPLPASVVRALERLAAEDRSSRSPGPTDFYALREYASGDDARLVHAGKSAAVGALVRKVNRGQEVHESALVLDLRRPPARSAQRVGPLFEWSLGATAAIVDDVVSRNGRLLCCVFGRSERTWTIDEPRDAAEFLAFLAQARPSRHAPASADVLDRVRDFRVCYWVPAGGHAAADERADLEDAILVTEWLAT